MSDQMPLIVEGPIGTEAVIVEAIANGAINLWYPVILASAGTGEDLPRVTQTTSGNDPLVYGVAVGPKRASGLAADAAGDKVLVCVFGRAKCIVAGKTVNIAIGDALVTEATNGRAVKLDITGTVNATLLQKILAAFAKALKASSADGDIIPVFVYPAIGTAKTS